MKTIKVYGADWCEDTQRTREHLDALKEPYQYINIDQDGAAREWVKQQNNGKQQTPTVDLHGHRVLIEPTNEALDEALKSLRPLSP